MEQIKDILPQVLGTPGLSTKEKQDSTEEWVNWFPDFRTLDDPQLSKMKKEAYRFGQEHYRAGYASEYEPSLKRKYPPRWLTLLGTSGAGKTMLAKRLTPFVYPWPTMATVLRGQQWGRFEDICNQKDIVCIDDIGSEYETDFVTAKLYELLCRREKHWTIITANLSLEEVADKMDTRIASRMIRHRGVVVEVNVPDYNLRSPVQKG